MTLPITESQNPLTLNLDVADPVGMLRLLRQSDAMMFSGYDTYPGLLDEEILEAMAKFAWRLSRLLGNADNRVLLTGAGTSGRLAHLMALEFNRVLAERRLPGIFRGLIAGGEAALIQAQEAAEDSSQAAVRDLKNALPEDFNRGIFVGITAGISAPYVAAQLDYLGGNEAFDCVLVGFNPASLARNKPVEGWDKTVKQVVDQASESDRFILVNPVYGPESVTGSTRMKGGSMTKIVIEAAFAVALEVYENQTNKDPDALKINEDNLLPIRTSLLERIRRYREVMDATYRSIETLSELVRQAGTALRSGGKIHYIGRGTAGALGIIDASECPPTFGADPFDVRGFIKEDWEFFGYNPAAMRSLGKAYEIGHEAFEQQVLPEISKGDLVIGVAIQNLGESAKRLIIEAAARRARTALLLVSTERPSEGDIPDAIRHRCFIDTPYTGFTRGIFNEAELGLKLALNAITTGAHIMVGKVYTNVMIDLRISNSKLYDRAAGLVQKLAKVDEDTARKALYQAIFKVRPTVEELAALSVTTAVQRACVRPRIVPLAILLATGKFTFDEALHRLDEEPRVRRIIEEVIETTTRA